MGVLKYYEDKNCERKVIKIFNGSTKFRNGCPSNHITIFMLDGPFTLSL